MKICSHSQDSSRFEKSKLWKSLCLNIKSCLWKLNVLINETEVHILQCTQICWWLTYKSGPIYRDRKESGGCQGLGRGMRSYWLMRTEFLLGGGRGGVWQNFWREAEVTVAQQCECPQHYWKAYFKTGKMVNFMWCVFYNSLKKNKVWRTAYGKTRMNFVANPIKF